ncbi:MAG: nuclear transport factor 2 family protein [Pseudomonadota bacterium]
MTNAQTVADRYIAAWNEADGDRRRKLIEETWTETAAYVDPLMKGDGHDGIDGLIRGVQARFPEFRFRLIGKPDGYADRLRFRWALGPDGSQAPVEGTDFAVLAPDGRLSLVTGFIDKAPAA